MTKENKITLATIKSFIKREAENDNLYIKVKSNFDGMIDCVAEVKDEFTKKDKANLNFNEKHTLGFAGLWLVGQSRDYFTAYADDNFIGYEIYNCCGSCIIAMAKAENDILAPFA